MSVLLLWNLIFNDFQVQQQQQQQQQQRATLVARWDVALSLYVAETTHGAGENGPNAAAQAARARDMVVGFQNCGVTGVLHTTSLLQH